MPKRRANNNIKPLVSGKPKRGRPSKAKEAVSSATKKEDAIQYKKISRQTGAILLFAVGVLLFALLIFGEVGPAGNLVKNIFRGLFGPSAFFIPIILIYIAILASLDRPIHSLKGKIFQGITLILLICGFIHIYSFSVRDFAQLLSNINYYFQTGTEFWSGGVAGALIGGLLLFLFHKIGAYITVLLLIAVFFMLVSNITLMQAIQWVGSLFLKKITDEELEVLAKEAADRNNKFNIDVDLGPDVPPLPEHPVRSPKREKPVIIEEMKPETVKPEPRLDDIIARVTKKNIKAEKPTENIEIESPNEHLHQQYAFPPITLLKHGSSESGDVSEELKSNAARLVETLKSFGVETRIINISRGPAVTRYELQPSAGVKISRITGLADDIALNLASAGVRIEAPIPNKAAVGIEVPNKNVSIVQIREMIDSKEFRNAEGKLSVALGRDISGNITISDISKMPHILIAGATGSGKSVCINSIIMSILYKATPDEVKIMMIDPKVVELNVYNGIPHLFTPVVTDPRKAAGALNWAVNEMVNRYKLFAENNVRDIKGYNAISKLHEEILPLPQIIIIIDELADLMMTAPNEVEDAICRLAQMARAAGMHLVIATQRPSVDVITGVIKANIPSRIAFAVSSQVDSRTILDTGGAEKLLGRGDMLYSPVGDSKPTRIQGCFVSDKEVEDVVDFIKNSMKAQYDEGIIEEIEKLAVKEKGHAQDNNEGKGSDDADEMLPQAIECVVEAGMASTSLLQRKLKLGYARAARIVDEMELRGIVGPFEGSKPRLVLISRQQWIEMNMNKVE